MFGLVKLCSLLRVCIGLVFFWLLLAMPPVRAQTPNDVELNLPRHDAVCDGGTVSKRKLAGVVLSLASSKNADVLPAVISYADAWRTIFSDPNFCKVPPNCTDNSTSEDCQAAAKCKSAKSSAVQAANRLFILLNAEVRQPNAAYKESYSLAALANDPLAQSAHYFGSESNGYHISCTREDIPKAPKPFDPTKDPVVTNFRVRGLSDELYVRRELPAFKGTTSATGNFSGDTSTAHTYTSKIIGAFGYAFGADTQVQAIPYFSLYQSITDTSGKPRVFDPNDNIAGGLLVQSYFDSGELSNVFSLKPQYLLYTSNKAELGSLRAIYTPTMATPMNINTFTRLDFLPWSPWWQFTVNLRSDTGSYANRGNTPAIMAVNRDFERAGTQVGFTLTTDGIANLPSLTLIVTETYLYGFSGFYRHLDLFQASLTYNFTNSYVGLTGSYKHGRDEDTAVASQMWLIGLSGHF
jgi:hypothetical protein